MHEELPVFFTIFFALCVENLLYHIICRIMSLCITINIRDKIFKGKNELEIIQWFSAISKCAAMCCWHLLNHVSFECIYYCVKEIKFYILVNAWFDVCDKWCDQFYAMYVLCNIILFYHQSDWKMGLHFSLHSGMVGRSIVHLSYEIEHDKNKLWNYVKLQVKKISPFNFEIWKRNYFSIFWQYKAEEKWQPCNNF